MNIGAIGQMHSMLEFHPRETMPPSGSVANLCRVRKGMRKVDAWVKIADKEGGSSFAEIQRFEVDSLAGDASNSMPKCLDRMLYLNPKANPEFSRTKDKDEHDLRERMLRRRSLCGTESTP